MGRSVKKGPFVAPELIKRVVEMNEKGEKKVLKTWSRAFHDLPRVRRSYYRSTRRPQSMFRYTLPRTWLVTSWASLLPPVPTRVTRAARPPITASKEELK